MSAVTIQQMADRVAALMQERLGVHGKDLAEKLRRAGRRLPSAIRAEARFLDTAAATGAKPRSCWSRSTTAGWPRPMTPA